MEADINALAGEIVGLSGSLGGLEARVDSLGLWRTYTPAWTSTGTQPSVGNGTMTGRYCQVGKRLFVQIKFVAGSTTTFGTGDYRLSLPIPANAATPNAIPLGAATMTDTGNTERGGIARFITKTTIEILHDGNGDGIWTTRWGPTSPFTFGNADGVALAGEYEAA